MAASVEEMTVGINQVAEQAADASICTADAGKKHKTDNVSYRSNRRIIFTQIENAVDNAASDIAMLEEKSREIASVINVIRGCRRTN